MRAMSRRQELRRLAAGLGLALAASFGGVAEAARLALVIGNGDYAHITTLDNALNDARDVSARLSTLGFRVFDGENLTKVETLELTRRFSKALRPDDVALFYYAGHGVQVGAENYLIPVDIEIGPNTDLALDSVKLQTLLRTIELRAETRIVILDACRDNPFAQTMATRSGKPATRGLAKVEAGVGSFIAFATQPGAAALDGRGRNSPFTEALIRHIGTPEADIHAVMRKVRADVHSATNGTQIPWENSSLVREIYLAPGAAPTPSPNPTPAPQLQSQPREPYHYVDGLDPNGDNFLALREGTERGARRLAKMGPGTLMRVLDQRGPWLRVRLRDGREGWAHGNWIRCCRQAPDSGRSTSGGGGGAQSAETTSCEDLWLRRNGIWNRYGYCFKGARGRAVFDNSDCSRDQAQARAAMSAADRAEVERLARLEAAQSCR